MLRRRANRHSEELAARASRQAALAELAQLALEGTALDELLDAAAAAIGRELGVEQVALLELTHDRHGLLARAGVGLPDGVLGGVLPLGPGDPPGPSALGQDLGAASSRQIPIETRGRRSGWIEAHSRDPRKFSAEEDAYLQAIARVLGAAGARARHDELVRDSEAQFRELADTTPALMWMTDAEGDVTFVNKAWLRFTGGSSDMGVTFEQTAHPEDREAALRRWEEASGRREQFRWEYRLRHAASGGYRWVLEEGTPRYSGGEFLGYVGTATDIQERRVMEEAPPQSEANFGDLADTAPAMMWTTDEDGLVTFVNEGWMRFHGDAASRRSSARAGSSVCTPRTRRRCSGPGTSARGAPLLGAGVPPAPPLGRIPLDRGPRRAALRGRPLRGLRGHRDRHPRAQDDGGRLLEVYQREHKIAETLQRSLLPERLPQIEACSSGPLPAGRPRRRDRRRLVRRARAPRRPRGARGGRRGRPRPARRRHHGPVSQRLSGLWPGGVVARPRSSRASPAGNERRGGRDGDGASTSCLTARPASSPTAPRGPHRPRAPADGPDFLQSGRSVPTGPSDPAVFREASAVLPPGSSLLLYTDGLVERRDVGLEERLEKLADVAGARRMASTRSASADRARVGDGEPGDDGDPRGTSAPGSAERHQPDTAGRARVARRACGAAWRASCTPRAHRTAEQYKLTLTICEAAGNAIEHAYGPGDATYEVEVTFADGELVATVRDSGSWRDKRGEHRGRGLNIIEELMDEVEVCDAGRRHRRDHAKASRRRTSCVTSPAEIAVQRRGGSVVAHVSGEVDMTNAAYLREQLLDSTPNDALALVIDISGCRYLDSAGVEVLFDLTRRLERRRQELRLVVLRAAAEARDRADRDRERPPVYESLDSGLSQ